jgi:sugar phosphate isomerase/epimerase
VVETISQIAEDPFFGAVEIGWIEDSEVRKAVKQVVEATHIWVAYGAQSSLLTKNLNLNSLDETARKRAVERLEQCADQAADMGAKRMAFLSGKDPGDESRPFAIDALVKSVRQVADYAREKGVALTLETFDRTIDKKALIGPSELALQFSQIIREDFPDFGLLVDLSHLPLQYEKSSTALNTLKDHLVHIHVGNCVIDPALPSYGDMHPRFGWPGGCNDVPELTEFISNLFKIGYLSENRSDRPLVGFEIKPQNPQETSAQLIAGTKRVWQEAWSRAEKSR